MTGHTHSPYLEDIPLSDALARWWSALADAGASAPLPGEPVPLDEAAGRITAEPVWARISSPHYHAAAMDGYAVRAEETRGASETHPVDLVVGQQAYYVDTGDPLPASTNAVIMVEDVQVRESQMSPSAGDGQTAGSVAEPSDVEHPPSAIGHQPPAIEILAAVAPWQHVRPMGEDMVATELILPANHRLRPQDIGAAAGAGHSQLKVRRKPRVAIQPTGTELIAPGAELYPGAIIEYNSLVLAAMVCEWGGQADRLPPLADDYAAIRERVLTAARDHDLVIINAGSSAGSEDFTARIVAELGELLVHGIAIRPGHPVILGLIHLPEDAPEKNRAPVAENSAASGTHFNLAHSQPKERNTQYATRTVPVIGLPGYPVSAAITCELLVKPTLARWLGQPDDKRPSVRATITRKVVSPEGDEEFLRVTVGQVGERVVASPLASGSGVLMSLVRADGIVRIPRGEQGFEPGATVTVSLFRPPESLVHTVVAIGSHDLTLDLLADELGLRYPGRRLSSANVGSLGGLLALARGEAHVAGSHLLDEETGAYNVTYIRRLLSGTPVVLLGFVQREQGLIVPRGNPKGIRGWADLTRPDVVFINRQRGAGTRVLLDYRLKGAGIAPRAIQGYDRQEFTHLAVAAAVASGAADCGLGILAAARALDLDFVALDHERYDLVIPAAVYASDVLAPLLAIVRDPAFAARVAALGGYATPQMGQILAQIEA
jgi:putative molybdopterin biosynthesis protein